MLGIVISLSIVVGIIVGVVLCCLVVAGRCDDEIEKDVYLYEQKNNSH